MIQRLGKGEANTEKIVAGFGEARPFRKWADYAAKLSDDLGVIHNSILSKKDSKPLLWILWTGYTVPVFLKSCSEGPV
ncbi:hypothetical protein [Sphaerochaeta sp.]|jgi:hypothetical protein|uniref:hypothetical protein n=1 Tax=Sphaerochaeta sp. TaxID=1972642 RepID=UPI002A35C42D|nr:hypothetical protein [Sphaerochaeta sp.]MDX9983578.1 hypothetical protein [Sphaerochaeta sp.]